MFASRLSLLLLVAATLFFSSLSHASDLADTHALLDQGKKAAKEKRYCDASFYFSWAYEKSNDPKHIYNAAEVAFAADDRTRALDLYVQLRSKHPSFTKMGTVRSRIRTLGTLFTDSGSGIRCEAPKGKPTSAAKDKAAKDKAAKDEAAKDEAAKDKAAEDKAAKLAEEKARAKAAKDKATKDKAVVDKNIGGTCGNGVLEEVETCDDGNIIDGDGCSSLCIIEKSGGGFPLAGVLTASTGVVLALVGGYGTYSISSTLNQLQELQEEAEDARDEGDFQRVEELEDQAGDLQENRFRPLGVENEDVYWGWGSVITFGVGVSMIVGGTLWALLAESGE